MLASEVMDEAAALMNDSGKFTWGYPELLPYLQRAYRTMELTFFLNGVRELKEISTVIDILENSETIPLPPDFVQPIAIAERAATSSDSFMSVAESEWGGDLKSDDIQYWVFREGELRINPPRTHREVKLRYRKSLMTITGENSNISIMLAKPYLSAKTAANASAFGASNAERAAILNAEANDCLSMLVNSEIRNQQGIKFRRRPYGYSRRSRGM
jgi:hypothetical protein